MYYDLWPAEWVWLKGNTYCPLTPLHDTVSSPASVSSAGPIWRAAMWHREPAIISHLISYRYRLLDEIEWVMRSVLPHVRRGEMHLKYATILRIVSYWRLRYCCYGERACTDHAALWRIISVMLEAAKYKYRGGISIRRISVTRAGRPTWK